MGNFLIKLDNFLTKVVGTDLVFFALLGGAVLFALGEEFAYTQNLGIAILYVLARFFGLMIAAAASMLPAVAGISIVGLFYVLYRAFRGIFHFVCGRNGRH